MRDTMLGKDLEELWNKTSDIVQKAVEKNPQGGVQYFLNKLVEAAADKEEVAVMVHMLGEMALMEAANRKQRRADAVEVKKAVKRAEVN